MISDAALKAAAWEISAVHYPDYEPDLELARKVLEAALPHVLVELRVQAGNISWPDEQPVVNEYKNVIPDGDDVWTMTDAEFKRELARAWDEGNIAGIFDLPSENHATPNPYRSQG